MARSRLTDYLQINRFHLIDVTFSLSDVPVLVPLFGFRSVVLPTWTTSYREIKEGNYEFKRFGAVERAEMSTVTLEQGVSFINSDFYDWIHSATLGGKKPRNLLLIQFTNINSNIEAGVTGSIQGAGINFGFEDGARFPGKAWLMKNCRPVSYKPGSDLDATSGEVSLAMLEFSLEEFVEFSLGI